jgi:activator-of-BECN1-regulated-autophagy protein 1
VECVLTGHERTPWTVKFHPHNNRLLASGSLDQTVRIWDVSTKQCLCRHHFDFVVSCIAFHSSGELLAVAAGKRILLWR